ncbi:hypothetical protein IFM89_011812 [Coptis chinensis]|uniref:Ammonium transporter AmtB-like domain-containing protein n=1 Tax=Coptis chinensis TaxID=261450 RepID=A0A835H5G9_9MAGN|nr:hypothetical protein IFM89_011812 [Coptis chinensis]
MEMAKAYEAAPPAVPDWLNKGDNAWQMTASTLVALQSMPGLVILYGSIVKKKWAVNSAFMALYAFAAVLICWVLLCYRMAFGDKLLPFWGKGAPALGQKYLTGRAGVPASTHYHADGSIETTKSQPFYPMATLVYFQFTFAAITMILLAGSVLGRMNIKAWMAFVPLWLIFSYTVGAFSLWGGGFLYQWGVIDYSGGYVIHLSSGIAGFTAAYWVGPRLKVIGRDFLQIMSYLCWLELVCCGWDGPVSMGPSVIGAVQGMMTGLVCITPGAGVVQSWAAIVMGILSGSIPWFTMMILHKKSTLLQKVDDTLGVIHTHAVAGLLGGLLTGLLAEPALCRLILPVKNSRGAFYGGEGGIQFLKQVVAALFIIGWNLVSTTLILLAIRMVIPLRMPDEHLLIGDDAVHGEEAYALWGDGEKYDATKHGLNASMYSEQRTPSNYVNGARGVTIQL